MGQRGIVLIDEQRAAARGSLPVDVFHGVAAAVIADAGKLERVVVHTPTADEQTHDLAVRNADVACGNVRGQDVELRFLREMRHLLFGHQKIVGRDRGGRDAVIAALFAADR